MSDQLMTPDQIKKKVWQFTKAFDTFQTEDVIAFVGAKKNKDITNIRNTLAMLTYWEYLTCVKSGRTNTYYRL